jgi:uncharacterized OB-fold protein
MGEWVELSQNGEIVTWTWAGLPFLGMPVQPPFVAALIRLNGTDCDLLHLIGGIDVSSPDKVNAAIRRGTSVKAVWADERRGHMLDIRYFEPR